MEKSRVKQLLFRAMPQLSTVPTQAELDKIRSDIFKVIEKKKVQEKVAESADLKPQNFVDTELIVPQIMTQLPSSIVGSSKKCKIF